MDPDLRIPVSRCSDCGFVYAPLLPDRAFLDLVYESAIDGDAGREHSLHPRWTSHQMRVAALLLARLSSERGPRAPAPRILDFGCGYGTVARVLSAAGASCVGFEPSRERGAFARACGVDVLTTLEEVASGGPYDGVVLSDVLEHVPEPASLLANCRTLLRPAGLLSVSVPEFPRARLRAIARQLSRGRLTTQDVNPWEHLNYFDNRSLKAMLARAGYSVLPPGATVDAGLRKERSILPRISNALWSASRALLYGISGHVPGTFFHARRT